MNVGETLLLNMLEGCHVVIVDDEEDSLEVACYILDFYGVIVHSGCNGQEGLALVEAHRPRFIISDLSMPVMDGWEFMHHLKKNIATRDIPVIALTAHAMAGDRERAFSAGFTNYITKPFNATTFINQLVTLLETPDLKAAFQADQGAMKNTESPRISSGVER